MAAATPPTSRTSSIALPPCAREHGTEDKLFEIHVISSDAYSPDGVRKLEDLGVTDVIVGFRWPYVTEQDTEGLQTKVDNLQRFADDVIAKMR